VSVFHNETRLEMFVEFCGVHVSFPLPLSRSRRLLCRRRMNHNVCNESYHTQRSGARF